MGVLSVLLLALVRLLSERPLGRSRKEPPMSIQRHNNTDNYYESPKTRHFGHYVLETIWAVLAGALAGCWLS
jgi:hypothetical protein